MALIAGLEWGPIIDPPPLTRTIVSPCSAHRKRDPGCKVCALGAPSDKWEVPVCQWQELSSPPCAFPRKFWIRKELWNTTIDGEHWLDLQVCITHFLPMISVLHVIEDDL